MKKLSEEGFDGEFLASVLHQVEMTGKIGKSNKGISLFEHFFHSLNERTLNQFEVYFNLTSSLQQIKEKEKKEKYFQNLIKKYLLGNQRQLFFVLRPDKDFLQKQQKEEGRMLLNYEKNLNEQKVLEIKDENQKLKKYQELEQNKNILPSLKITDIPKETKKTEIHKKQVEGVDIHFVNDITKGLT